MKEKTHIRLAPAPVVDDTGPPRPLGEAGARLWSRIMAEYAISDEGGREMLAQACAALDRAEACAEHIRQDGEVVRTKTGLKDHPALKHEISNRSFVVRTLARLGLDVEPVKAVGRPPAGGYRA